MGIGLAFWSASTSVFKPLYDALSAFYTSIAACSLDCFRCRPYSSYLRGTISVRVNNNLRVSCVGWMELMRIELVQQCDTLCPPDRGYHPLCQYAISLICVVGQDRGTKRALFRYRHKQTILIWLSTDFIRLVTTIGHRKAIQELDDGLRMLACAKFWSFCCKTWYSKHSKRLPPVAFWQL